MKSTTQNLDEALTISAQLATIALAVISVLAASLFVLVFVVRSVIATDITPRLDRLELSVTSLSARVDSLDSRLDSLEQGQREIIELLTESSR
ncbi:hypothetical protein [Acaryochloris marina]|uniref:hypothetical protein n=1 Tax=Acaryochloris marina TaxID=155978 RepID=UPI0021C46DA8|nr:hypothetical protein [Acaryochloris marina]BDM82855.1 hypothetical protein AM10699_57160 [Acaryochloris marina MBIC10699]